MSRANAAVLFGNVRPNRRGVIQMQSARKQVLRHLSRVFLSEAVEHIPIPLRTQPTERRQATTIPSLS
jgi:hypothetical protein